MRWTRGVFTVIALSLVIPLVAPSLVGAADATGSANEASRERLLGMADHPVEAIVLLDAPDAWRVHNALARLGLRAEESFSLIDGVVVTAPPRLLLELLDAPGVRAIYPSEPLQFNLYRSRGVVNADDAATRFGTTGEGVTVAVVDSGADLSHPALAGRVRASLRFGPDGSEPSRVDNDGHGTHVAGIVAGDGAKSEGRRNAGLAPDADLVALDISTSFTTTNAIRAFQWIHDHHAEYGIRVVSNSWGREKPDAHYDAEDPVIRASSALVADGLVVVFSAGNRGEGDATLTVEATNPDVITVGATNNQGALESYSSRGPVRDASGRQMDWLKPDLVAPGTHIQSARSAQGPQPPSRSPTEEERYYMIMNGTSMAAPHVAAAAALLISKDPTLSPFLVRDLLIATARDRGPVGPDAGYGHGLVDVRGALEALEGVQAESTTQEVEVRKEFRATGSFGTAGSFVLLEGAAPKLPPTDVIRIPLATEAGARSVSFSFAWSASTTSFQVFLVDDTGNARYGPFVAKRDGRIDATVDDLPDDRKWHLEAYPRGIAGQGTYDLTGEATLLEMHTVTGKSVAKAPFAGTTGGLRNPGAVGFFEEQARLDSLRAALSARNLMTVGALAGVLTLAVLLWVRRKK